MGRAKNILRLTYITLLVLVGCSNQNTDVATIAVNSDAEYNSTFEELHLGELYNFDFSLPHADERWVRVWVEKYIDGEKQEDPLIELSYGMSPNKYEEGSLGFGVINPHSDTPLGFLYAPGVTQEPRKIDLNEIKEELPFNGDYAIGNDVEELQLGETLVLGVYRRPADNLIKMYDYQNEEELLTMIQDDHIVLLLKIKVEEEKE
ncbi:hypothetical protein SAMN05216389_101352 [Oceanobacillus limi]|uniref:Lipoprotein n=1 Tax=Oceanobacillus limi TaxID=930131 RepID=A0A1H9YFK5_9BACI|nr:hypothetical protein [Oceanobacillus limi]SES67333.1 hypothetical protein SAMN05216389_101352 [Oceanobacillus limi]